jgi:hypothetical protein
MSGHLEIRSEGGALRVGQESLIVDDRHSAPPSINFSVAGSFFNENFMDRRVTTEQLFVSYIVLRRCCSPFFQR